MEKARANNYWLVLVYHPVPGDDLGVNPYGDLHEALRASR